jgi:hypothetical protein
MPLQVVLAQPGGINYGTCSARLQKASDAAHPATAAFWQNDIANPVDLSHESFTYSHNLEAPVQAVLCELSPSLN